MASFSVTEMHGTDKCGGHIWISVFILRHFCLEDGSIACFLCLTVVYGNKIWSEGLKVINTKEKM